MVESNRDCCRRSRVEGRRGGGRLLVTSRVTSGADSRGLGAPPQDVSSGSASAEGHAHKGLEDAEP